nr:MAG TPA: hypothetical protein [Caudoviricetes sp.]
MIGDKGGLIIQELVKTNRQGYHIPFKCGAASG